MSIIVVKQLDGSCSIIKPAPEMLDATSKTRALLALRELLSLEATEQEVMDFIINKDVPKGLTHRVIEESAIPTDRFFRNAWTDDKPTKTVDIDIPKAKEIKRNHFRDLRVALLTCLDIDFMKALEQGKPTKAISDKKQALRDVTKLELPSNLEELKAFIPDILK